jgi:hypothetical protein
MIYITEVYCLIACKIDQLKIISIEDHGCVCVCVSVLCDLLYSLINTYFALYK